MKIILKSNVERLGNAGEVVEVAPGYARNYLFPHRLALEATVANVSVYREEKRQKAIIETKEKRNAGALAKELERLSFTAVVPVGEDDRVFGSVTSQMIANLIKAKGYEVDRRKILLEEPIKALGIYTVPIKLHPEVEVKVKVWVVKE